MLDAIRAGGEGRGGQGGGEGRVEEGGEGHILTLAQLFYSISAVILQTTWNQTHEEEKYCPYFCNGTPPPPSAPPGGNECNY